MGGGSRVPAGDLTQDDEQAIVESVSYTSETIPPGNHAAGRLHKRRDSLLDIILNGCYFMACLCTGSADGRDGRRTNSLETGGGFGPTNACDVHQSQGSCQDTKLPSSSALQQPELPSSSALQQPELPSSSALQQPELPFSTALQQPELPSSSALQQPEMPSSSALHQPFRTLEVDGVKHKIFMSHSGAQKDFVEQLCVDLERGGCIAPFFDQRDHSLPKGKDFAPLIKEAAQHCDVAVIVLSEKFLCSKWPMIELAEFHAAQQAGNQWLNMLPLFYMLSVEDLKKKAVEERWMPKWRELAKDDKSIDVLKWSEAVRALRKVNGEVFGQKGLSKVRYRKDIVRSILKLSPPDLSYGSFRSMVGFSRICKMVSNRFVRDTRRGPSFLGLYGTNGAGKTTLAKALCDHFRGEYMGRVCLVDLGETFGMSMACPVGLNETWRLRWLQLERVKRMLDKLCGLDKKLLDKITDLDEGLTLMHRHMKRQPVFLAMDNVTNESSSWNEALKYLMAGFHPESKIVITSRSRLNIGGLVPDIQLCVPMPRLSVREAGELFLRSADPSKSIFGLTGEERRIVGLCIKQCLFEAEVDEGEYGYGDDEVGFLVEGDVSSARWKSYHPVALLALGDFFRRYFSNGDMLQWRGDLEENMDPLRGLWRVQNGIRGIFELQFHSLPLMEQLLFLDIATFTRMYSYVYFSLGIFDKARFEWLCKVYEETWQGMERQLQDLERSGMIMFHRNRFDEGDQYVEVAHDMYQRFAEWYVTNHGVKQLKNAWCVCITPGSTLNQSSTLWSDLVRIRMFDITCTSARLLTSKMMRELRNLEVLQLYKCPYLRELNLEGLASLRHLELVELQNLEAVKLIGSLDIVQSGGVFESLHYVELCNLGSLVHGPDIRLYTSLHWYTLLNCPTMTNLEEMECPHLKELLLWGLVADQLKRLPIISALHPLDVFEFDCKCCITWSEVEASRENGFLDLGEPSLRVVEELLAYLCTEWVSDDVIARNQIFIYWWNGDLSFSDNSGRWQWSEVGIWSKVG